MLTLRTLPLLFVLLAPLGDLPAQLNLFSGASFEHEVSPRWGYQFEVEHRQVVNTGRDNRLLLLGAINRQLVGRLDITPGLRFTPKYNEDPSTLRLFTDLNYSHPLGDGPFALESRVRTQYERSLADTQTGPEIAVRPRLGLVYRLLEHTALVAEYEARYRFDTRDAWTQHRYTLGLEQMLSTRISLEGFFRLEREVDQADPTTEPTVGIFLVYVLPDERERDWRYRSPFGRSLLW